MPDELWMEVCDIVQEIGIKTFPKEKKCKKGKWLSEEALQIAVKRRETKGKGENERYLNSALKGGGELISQFTKLRIKKWWVQSKA